MGQPIDPAALERLRGVGGQILVTRMVELFLKNVPQRFTAAREGLAEQLASHAAESWWREVALLSLRRSRPFCESFYR